MKKSIIEKAHDFILKMPSFLEKIVAAIIVGVSKIPLLQKRL